MTRRSLLLAVGVAICLGVGLPLPPAAGAPSPPPTVSEHLAGLPVADGEPQPAVARQSAAPVRSARVQTPIPYSTIGFAMPEGAQVSFRTSVDGTQWGPWQQAPALGAAHGPDEGSPEAAHAPSGRRRTKAVWLGEASWLQVRVRGGSPAEVGVTLIDAMGLSRSWPQRAVRAVRRAWTGSARPDRAAAAVASPDIISRSEWGADESRRGHEPHYTSNVELGAVHHTAGANDYSESEAAGVVRGIYRWHTEGLGWSDIGYNLLVDRFGNVYEGRFGGLEKGVIGAHAKGWNDDSFGVAVMGCFDPGCEGGGGSLPDDARDALVEVLAWKFDVHHVDIRGKVDVNGRTMPTLVGHRDVGATSCPGDAIAGKLDDIADQVAQRQTARGGVIVEPEATPASARLGDSGLEEALEFTSRLRPPGAWQLEVLNPESQVVRTDHGAGEVARSRWQGTDQLEPGSYTFTFSSPGRRPASSTVTVSSSCEQAFCDIQGSVHEGAILSLHEREIVSGCEENRYCPREKVRRDHMAAFMARALELEPESGTAEPRFSDVAGNTHSEHINALADAGIAKGKDGRFLPDEPISRAQMASFLARGLDLDAEEDGHFSDIQGSVHADAINAIAEAGVTKGYPDGTYRPDRDVLRDQIASFLHRALDEAGSDGAS